MEKHNDDRWNEDTFWLVGSLSVFAFGRAEEKSDLVVEMCVESNFDNDDLYSSEAEAWRVARQYLTEQRDQALKDLDSLSKPYTYPSGHTYICPKKKIDAWKEETRKRLSIAEKGLECCPC